MIVALIALVIALGGTAFAQTVLPRNSVGPRQIRANAVRSSEVKDRSLRVADLSVQARRALRGRRGPAGPPGPAGGAGAGTATTLTVVTAPGVVSAGNVTSATATCPPGRTVTGGGVRIDSAGDSSARESYPSQGNTAWTARVGNDDVSGNFNYTVFAICAA
jgi:hypothetical protein